MPDASTSGTGRQGTARSRLRVLVVDDVPGVRTTLVRLVERRGHAVVGEGATVADAVAMAAQLAPDVVLLDLELPDGLGTEAAARITATARDAGRPAPAVVLCTGNPGRLAPGEVERAGVYAVLSKPLSADALDEALHGAVHSATSSPALDALVRNLRSTIVCYVETRRSAGISLERLAAEVCCLVRESESSGETAELSDALLRQVVEWTADAYGANVPRGLIEELSWFRTARRAAPAPPPPAPPP